MKGLIILLILVVLGVGSYVYFTANNNVVLEEDSPLVILDDSLNEMDAVKKAEFDAAMEDMKDKVIDVVEKGYTMNDKVIRFAKVVTGM